MPLAKLARSTRSSPPLYERHTTPVASTARRYTPLPRTGVWVFWRKISLMRLRPRATLLDAGEKAATCLAPLVRTSNASPPVFLEDFWRTRAHSRVIHSTGPVQPRARGARATTVIGVGAAKKNRSRDCRHHYRALTDEPKLLVARPKKRLAERSPESKSRDP